MVNKRKLLTLASQPSITKLIKKKLSFKVVIILFIVILLEELLFGVIQKIFKRDNERPQPYFIDYKIQIFTVITDMKMDSEYKLPVKTMACYANFRGYDYVRISLDSDRLYFKLCQNRDFMFLRHCILYHYLVLHPEVDYVLVIDGDMGVINPHHLIESYLEDEVDITFYNRLFTYEIMAGSFLVKNTKFTQYFLRYWFEYEDRHPKVPSHGTDNGAIQKVFLDLFCPECSNVTTSLCQILWNTSRTVPDLFLWEACIRSVLGDREYYHSPNKSVPGTIKVLSDVKDYWARDGWQTLQNWSDNDFMIHGWQESRRHKNKTVGFESPFLEENFPADQCYPKYGNATRFWVHDPARHRPVEEILNVLNEKIKNRTLKYLQQLKIVTTLRTEYLLGQLKLT